MADLTRASLPNVGNAKLPVNYEKAREALDRCATVDECKEWRDKAAAIASYAKQSEDESLFQLATRIRARAIRRCGEIFKSIPEAPHDRSPGRPPQNQKGAAAPQIQKPTAAPSPRAEAARAAGMSPDQQKQAIRLANIPAPAFERAIERPKPPTIGELEELGTKKKRAADHLQGRDPKEFQASTHAQAALRRLVEMTLETSARVTARGALPGEFKQIRAHLAAAKAWLEDLELELERVR